MELLCVSVRLYQQFEECALILLVTMAMQRGSYWIKPILDSGAELSCGGHRYRDNLYVDPREEDALIQKSIEVFQDLTGDKTQPKGMVLLNLLATSETLKTFVGWLVERRSNLSVKLYSLASKASHLPLLYSSDSCADDLPYWIPSFASPDRSQGLLMIPFSYDCSDLRFDMRGSGWASPKDYYLHLVRGLTSRHIVKKANDLLLDRKTRLTAFVRKRRWASPR